ncbi:Nup93/Nic96-domain-containing protein [Pilaira anomala]|nr:Nup93/Nic96-domain-containing protein [Pilaira anomala]
MSSERLNQILKQAQLTLSDIEGGNLRIRKSVEQLVEAEPNKKRTKTIQELHAKAHYFLASQGINTDRASVDTSRTFETGQREVETDIREINSEAYERNNIENIEDNREFSNDRLMAIFKQKHAEFIETRERGRKEKDENMADLQEYEKETVISGVNRVNDYAKVVTALNENRLVDADYDLLKNLSSIRNLSDLKRSQDGANDAWSILNHLINKSGIYGRLEGRFLRDYTTKSYYSAIATNTRRGLIHASKSWLEQQYSQHINDVLNKNADKIKVGGIPSFTHRLRAYIDLVFKTTPDSRTEVVDGLPIWVFIYHLLRSGNLDLATKFIDSNGEMFASDRKFAIYFQEYITAEHHNVSELTRKAILADYIRLYENDADPYKLIIYKIMGRCELHRKHFPDVIKTTEDYIWLQLMLIREVTETERYSSERYRLEDLQKSITALGSKYFDKDQTNPYIYFNVLLLTHQFEEAIDYLYKQNKLQPEAIHFAILLVYCGLLNICQPDKHNSYTILITNVENRVTLNFPRLLYRFIKVYLSNKPNEALQYLYILSLYSPKQGYPDDTMVQIAKDYVCEFIQSSKDYKHILGVANGQERIPGPIDKQKELLNINQETEFAKQIIEPIARKFYLTGRRMDAAYTYSLSKDYNEMMFVVAKELSDALYQTQSFRSTNPSLSLNSNTEIIQFALETVQYYEDNQYISPLIDENKKTTAHILIQLLQFRVAYDAGQYDKALQLIQQVNIIPIGGDFEHLRLLSEQFNGLDELIKKNIPELMLNIMDCLLKIKTSSPKTNNLEDMSQVLLGFTALIQFSIPKDIINRLNEIDKLIRSYHC